MAKKYHLNQKDRDLVGRTIRTVQGMGRGELPLPRRRRMVDGGTKGSPGASGAFLCTLTADIGPGSITNRTAGTGTIYSMSQGAGNTEVGIRPLWNPFIELVPKLFGAEVLIYSCAKTYEHDPLEAETEADDEFTIVGIVRGLGCSPLEVVTGVSCVDGEILVDTEEINYVSAPCG